MLVARPILATALPESDLAKLIEVAGCGWYVEPDRPDLLAEGLRRVVLLCEDERRRLGRAGRTFVLARLTADVCLPRVLEVLQRCSANRQSPSAVLTGAHPQRNSRQ
jgi:hypothetical protein